MNDKLLTSLEVAKRWGVHKATVLRLYHSGALPGVLISPGKKRVMVRFRLQSIETWEQKMEQQPIERAGQ